MCIQDSNIWSLVHWVCCMPGFLIGPSLSQHQHCIQYYFPEWARDGAVCRLVHLKKKKNITRGWTFAQKDLWTFAFSTRASMWWPLYWLHPKLVLFHSTHREFGFTRNIRHTWIWIVSHSAFRPKGDTPTPSFKKGFPNALPVAAAPPRGKFSHFLACTGILRPVTPHRLALCSPLGEIVIFIYQLIAMLPAWAHPPKRLMSKADKNRKTIPSLSAPISHTSEERLLHPISTHQRLDITGV